MLKRVLSSVNWESFLDDESNREMHKIFEKHMFLRHVYPQQTQEKIYNSRAVRVGVWRALLFIPVWFTGTGSPVPVRKRDCVCAKLSTCAPGIRYLTWWNVSGALCTCASDSARMEDAHMCARLINIAIYRAGVVAASMTNWRKCARPCKEYTVVGPVAHRAGTSSW